MVKWLQIKFFSLEWKFLFVDHRAPPIIGEFLSDFFQWIKYFVFVSFFSDHCIGGSVTPCFRTFTHIGTYFCILCLVLVDSFQFSGMRTENNGSFIFIRKIPLLHQTLFLEKFEWVFFIIISVFLELLFETERVWCVQLLKMGYINGL